MIQVDNSYANANGHGGTLNANGIPQDGSGFDVSHHSFNKQHSFVLGMNQMHGKESYNNLAAPNFLLPLNKAQVRTDNGEGAGSNMAQLLRSVLANPDP